MKKILFIAVVFSLLLSSLSYANPIKQIFEQATMAYSKGDYVTAIKLYEKTLELYPEFAPAYHFLGLSHKGKGTNIDEVIWLFKRAIEIDPQYVAAYDQLSKSYYVKGDFENSEQYALEALKIDPNLVSAQLSIAWTYVLGLSSPREAIPYFKQVIAKHDIPYAHYGLGMAYFMDGQKPLVLETITSLRRSSNEKLANQLEAMMHKGHYDNPTMKRKPLIQATTVKNEVYHAPSVLVEQKPYDNDSFQNSSGMKVRLREKMTTRGLSTNSNDNNRKSLSGAERIREMQKKSQNKGSSYSY